MIKIIIKKYLEIFDKLWKIKIFKYALILQVFYFVFSIILTLGFFPDTNDFLVYYKVGEVFLNNPNDLYIYEYNWPFRYLPISAFLFVPFTLMGFQIGFVMFNLMNFILNILICYILYQIIIRIKGQDHEKDHNRVILYICLYLMGLPQVFNYILGQINLYVTVLILLSLLYFIKYESNKYQFIAGILLGLSIIIKPTTIFMIPFLLIINYREKRLNFNLFGTLSRLLGLILPISLNFIMFLIYPSLLDGFISKNLTGSDTVIVNHSFSITKLISNFFLFLGFSSNDINILLIFLSVLLIVGGIGFVIYVLRKISKNSILYGYVLGMIIMLLTYFDSWDHHLLNLTPLLIIVIFNIPRNSEITKKFIKPGFFFLNFFDLLFMGIYWLVQGFFPFNFVPTIFLLLLFIGINKFLLKK